MLTPPSPKQNALLASLPESDFNRLVEHLEPIKLPLGMVLHEPGQPMDYVYFPTDSVVSLMYILATGASVEIAVIGFEGIVGLTTVLGGSTTTSQAVVQAGGYGYRLKATILQQELEHSVTLNKHLLRFTQAIVTLMGQTAVCNRHHAIEQQVCKWILMMADRQPKTTVTMTHELISNMLGVRREGVTEAAGRLQKAGLIQYSRGVIEILNRQGLEDQVCECYGVVRKEFERLANMRD